MWVKCLPVAAYRRATDFFPPMARFVNSLRSLFSTPTPTPEPSDDRVASEMVTTRRSAAAQQAQQTQNAQPGASDTAATETAATTQPTDQRKRKLQDEPEDAGLHPTSPGEATAKGALNPSSPRPKKKRSSPEVVINSRSTSSRATTQPTDQESLPERLRKQDDEPVEPEPARTHIRFGSDSPPPDLSLPDEVAPRNDVEDGGPDDEDQSSDDEAPEAVTLENAEEEARAREAVAAKAKEK
jgi:hypothetical protein